MTTFIEPEKKIGIDTSQDKGCKKRNDDSQKTINCQPIFLIYFLTNMKLWTTMDNLIEISFDLITSKNGDGNKYNIFIDHDYI